MTVTKGGKRRNHKGRKATQAYLRRQVMAGKGHDAMGNPTTLDLTQAMGRDLFYGYKADRHARQ
jgi:hypothetical protein